MSLSRRSSFAENVTLPLTGIFSTWKFSAGDLFGGRMSYWNTLADILRTPFNSFA